MEEEFKENPVDETTLSAYNGCDEASTAQEVSEPSADTKHEESEKAEAPTERGNLSHLTSSVPRAARVPSGALTKQEMAEIRSIFGNMDDAEIQRLYKRVTK